VETKYVVPRCWTSVKRCRVRRIHCRAMMMSARAIVTDLMNGLSSKVKMSGCLTMMMNALMNKTVMTMMNGRAMSMSVKCFLRVTRCTNGL